MPGCERALTLVLDDGELPTDLDGAVLSGRKPIGNNPARLCYLRFGALCYTECPELFLSGDRRLKCRTYPTFELGLQPAEHACSTVSYGSPPPKAAAHSVLSDRSMVLIPPEASPQPSGWACDVKEQPSARGRLRAAGPDGPNLSANTSTMTDSTVSCWSHKFSI